MTPLAEKSRKSLKSELGVTFLELVVAVAIIGILAAIAAPYYGDYVTRQRLIGASQAILSQVQFAKRAAISNNATIYVVLKGAQSQNWCVTVSQVVASVAADCSGGWIVSSANQSIRVKSEDYTGITLNAPATAVDLGFSMPAVSISGTTAVSLSSGSSDLGYLEINVSPVQLIDICASKLGSYPAC